MIYGELGRRVHVKRKVFNEFIAFSIYLTWNQRRIRTSVAEWGADWCLRKYLVIFWFIQFSDCAVLNIVCRFYHHHYHYFVKIWMNVYWSSVKCVCAPSRLSCQALCAFSKLDPKVPANTLFKSESSLIMCSRLSILYCWPQPITAVYVLLQFLRPPHFSVINITYCYWQHAKRHSHAPGSTYVSSQNVWHKTTSTTALSISLFFSTFKCFCLTTCLVAEKSTGNVEW